MDRPAVHRRSSRPFCALTAAVSALLAFGLHAPRRARAAVDVINLGEQMAWQVATGDLDHSGVPAIVVGTYGGHILRVETSAGGRIAWDYDTTSAESGGAFFQVAVGDLVGGDGGALEIVAASADGAVYALSASGTLLWRRDLAGGPVQQAQVARLQGSAGPARVVACNSARDVVVLSADGTVLHTKNLASFPPFLRTGDLLGDGRDRVFVAAMNDTDGRYALFLLGDEDLRTLASTPIPAPAPFVMDGNGFGGTVGRISGRGRLDVITESGAATYDPADLAAGPAWTVVFDTAATSFPRSNVAYSYRSPRLASGDLTAQDGDETVVVDGPDLALYAANGMLLGSVQVGNPTQANDPPAGPAQPRGFTSAAFLPGTPHGRLVLGSSPNGDDNLYLVTFDDSWRDDLRNLASPHGAGVDAKVRDNLLAIDAAATAWTGVPAIGQPGPYPLTVIAGFPPAGGAGPRATWAIDAIRGYLARFPPDEYPHVRFVAEVLFTEAAATAAYAPGDWPRDTRYSYDHTEADLRAYAEAMEAANAEFWLWAGHGESPYLTLDTIERVFRDFAPTTCLGLIQAENPVSSRMAEYAQNVIRPQLELARRYGKLVAMREKHAYWAAQAAIPELRDALFTDEYRRVLAPSVEQSNARVADINLAARVGLWLDGWVDQWDCSMATDWFRFNRAVSTAYPLAGHPLFRYFVAHAAMGATLFRAHTMGVDREPRIREGWDPFVRLLGKGILAPPTREQVCGVSPVVLRVRPQTTTTRFVKTHNNGHNLRGFDAANDGPETAWAFGQMDCYWGLARTLATDASTILWGRRNQFDNHIPASRYGLVAVVPSTTARGGFPWTGPSWETDGDELIREGVGFGVGPANQRTAGEALRADLEAAAAELPFAVEGDPVFFQIAEQSDDTFHLYLIDPLWMEPRDRSVTLRFRGVWTGADRLGGEAPATVSPTWDVLVPAGALRILELTRVSAVDPDAGTDGGGDADDGDDGRDAGSADDDADAVSTDGGWDIGEEGDVAGADAGDGHPTEASGKGCGCAVERPAAVSDALPCGWLLVALAWRRHRPRRSPRTNG